MHFGPRNAHDSGEGRGGVAVKVNSRSWESTIHFCCCSSLYYVLVASHWSASGEVTIWVPADPLVCCNFGWPLVGLLLLDLVMPMILVKAEEV